MSMISFESLSYKLQRELPQKVESLESYLICNIYSEFSLYIVNASHDLISRLSTEYVGELKSVEAVRIEDFIYADLQVGGRLIGGSTNFFFNNRPVDKSNWFVDTDKVISKAKIATFYSFKGGLGRTTALVLAAIHLARLGKKVALVDFDLEAPGLSSLFLSDFPKYSSVRGVSDFLVDITLNNYDINNIDFSGYYFTLTQQDLVGSNGGELIIIPATHTDFDAERTTNYIDTLSKINLQYDSTEEYPPDFLFKAIDSKLAPDFILIDSRTGVNDIGGIMLNRYPDATFMFFYGNQQNMFGLQSLSSRIDTKRSQVYLINSPVPRDAKAGDEEKAYFIENSYDIFSKSVYLDNNILPDIYDETADHYPIHVPYSDTAAFLNSTRKLKILLEEGGTENPYVAIGELILSLSAESQSKVDNDFDANKLVEAISRIIDKAATSETEFLSIEDLRTNFYPRRDYRFIFDKNRFLILGEKGSGKTALYAALAHNNYAKSLARFCETSNANNDEWNRTEWIKGLDTDERFPSATNFKNLKELTDSQLRNYWLLLLSREVTNLVDVDFPQSPILQGRISTFRTLAIDDTLAEELEEFLNLANKFLITQNKYIIVVYDYLDRLLTEEANLRGRLVGALLGLWYEYQNRFSNLRSKIFLRKDIYDREIPTGLTDKVKLDNFKQEIEWDQSQLLNLVWKRVLEQDPTTVTKFIKSSIATEIEENDGLGFVPSFSVEQHTKLLEGLFGKRMGGNNKAFPYNWIMQHIADTHKHIQPRSILNLFGLGAQHQLKNSTTSSASPAIIRALNFESVLIDVSEGRVRDLIEEYPEYKPFFDGLNAQLKKFPVSEAQLIQAIQTIISSMSNGSDFNYELVITKLKDIGVLYEYTYNKKNIGMRYHIPDLYLFGLGLRRLGPGARKDIFDGKMNE